MLSATLLCLIHLAAPAATPLPAPELPGEAVIRAAYERYAGKWFHTVTYIQRTTFPDKQPRMGQLETWYTAIELPRKMRVDVGPATTGRALIYRNDSLYNYGRGTLQTAAPSFDPLLTLLGNLHTQAPATTAAELKKYFDLRKSYETRWLGRSVIVVGAVPGDTTSNQFWLEKERMLLVRVIQANASNPRAPLDARINDYQAAAGGWLEHNIRVYLGGHLSEIEDYTSIKINPVLEAGLFNPRPYRLPKWVNGAPDVFGGVPAIPLPPQAPVKHQEPTR